MKKQTMIISGSSNVPLALALARKLNADIGDRLLEKFPNNETHVRIISDVLGKDVLIVQSLCGAVNDQVMELLLLADAARRSGAKRVRAVIPWLGYSTQDQTFLPGEPASAAVLAKAIETSGIEEIYALDVHSQRIAGYYTIPFWQISFMNAFVAQLKKRDLANAVVVSPDKGGEARSSALGKLLNIPVASIHKTRCRHTGNVEIHDVTGNIVGKDCVLFDDFINTGATAIESSKFLKMKGAKTVIFMATHGGFANGWAPFEEAQIDEIFISDTIPLAKGFPEQKIQVISVDDVLAAAIGMRHK